MMTRALNLGLLLCCLLPACGHNRPESGRPRQLPLTRVDGGLNVGECNADPPTSDGPAALRTSARCVEASLRLADVSGSHRMRFLYYDPQGNLYVSTKTEWTVQPDGG